MDHSELHRTIQDELALYEWYLRALMNERSVEETTRERALAVGGVHAARQELKRLVALAQSQVTMTDDAQFLEHTESKLSNLDSWYRQLLEQLGAQEVQRSLVEMLRFYVSAYRETVKGLERDYQSLSPKEFTEYQLDDQLMYAQCLADRDLIDLVLQQVPRQALGGEVIEKLEEADRILFERGRLYLQPLFEIGLIQRGREARFEPPERWWYYLDSLEKDSS